MSFAPWLARWNLLPDGGAIHTASSDLLPVVWEGQAAMLKLARLDEEERGHRLMVWWAGRGAARVYAHEGAALLMERLSPEPSLAAWVDEGQDDEASRVLCRAVARLHEPRGEPWPDLVPLRRWFRALEAAAPAGGTLMDCWTVATGLLDDPQDVRPLHGDIHHANVLHSPGLRGDCGWLAIDPKGILGERGYDYANILSNPTQAWALRPGRLARQVRIVSQAAGLERSRLLRWIVAYSGLSAAWHLEDGDEAAAARQIEIAQMAAGELGGS
ncbi:aminoglycoside phosphotransferase family protein [Deinococcus koreensis]|uniref:3'-kinase n=1 Tax=Deinococcus koreensis TaxID=2054903 RepID=A0A2K3UU68_9DEIO|nr:aminoglycoside phosphotransferase family protein [Deinococcus koreensis]PNY80081.1 3'-kinase [Deinococcus koreensis]